MKPTQTCKFAFEGFNQPNMGLEARKTWGSGRNNGVCRTAAGLNERMDLNTPKHGKLNRHFSIGTTTNYYDEHYYRSHMFSLLLRFLFSLLIRSPLFQRLILDMICYKKTTIINYQQSWNSSNQFLSLSLPIIHWFILPYFTHGWFILPPRLVLKGRTMPTHTMEVIGRKGRFGGCLGCLWITIFRG